MGEAEQFLGGQRPPQTGNTGSDFGYANMNGLKLKMYSEKNQKPDFYVIWPKVKKKKEKKQNYAGQQHRCLG